MHCNFYIIILYCHCYSVTYTLLFLPCILCTVIYIVILHWYFYIVIFQSILHCLLHSFLYCCFPYYSYIFILIIIFTVLFYVVILQCGFTLLFYIVIFVILLYILSFPLILFSLWGFTGDYFFLTSKLVCLSFTGDRRRARRQSSNFCRIVYLRQQEWRHSRGAVGVCRNHWEFCR